MPWAISIERVPQPWASDYQRATTNENWKLSFSDSPSTLETATKIYTPCVRMALKWNETMDECWLVNTGFTFMGAHINDVLLWLILCNQHYRFLCLQTHDRLVKVISIFVMQISLILKGTSLSGTWQGCMVNHCQVLGATIIIATIIYQQQPSRTTHAISSSYHHNLNHKQLVIYPRLWSWIFRSQSINKPALTITNH